jgi:deoxyribonuclease-4
MIWIGNHVSVSDGYLAMGRHETDLGGNTFAFFPRKPRGGKSRPVSREDVLALGAYIKEQNFGPLVVHGAYTMNVCAAKEEVRRNSLEMLRDDLLRLQDLPGNYYNFHPGSHVGQGAETGIVLIAEALVSVIRAVEEASGLPLQNRILLETMAGKGSEMGGSFPELRAILDRTAELGGDGFPDKLGVCLDTCHIWDGGYDIVDHLDDVLAEFDDVIGIDRLLAVHLNDSLNPRGSHKDRHAKIGEGQIGLEALVRVINHPLLRRLPFILETPNDHDGYAREIALLRGRFGEDKNGK